MTNAQRSTSTNNATSPAAAAWRIAVSNYASALADFERHDAEHGAANAAFYAELGNADADFSTYGLGVGPRFSGNAREDRIFQIAMLIAASEYVGQHVTAEEYATIAARATRLVDGHNAYTIKRNEVFARTIGKVEKAWEASLEALSEARGRLIATPAPDAAAMLTKLDILSAYMAEGDDEGHEQVAAIRDDARRLFGSK